jgi:heat shock protein HslJ
MFKQILMASVIGSSVLFTACTNMPDQGNTTVDVVQAQLLDRNWTVTYIGNTEIVKTSQAVQTLPSLMLE